MPKLPLTNFDTTQALDVVWETLSDYRENLIPEGDEMFDAQWDDICTAMAWIEDELKGKAQCHLIK